MLKQYYTIEKDGTHEIDIRKSRFICHLKRVATEEEAQDFIESIRKEHWKANHNCVAYVIGEKDEIQRAYDDGEPSGTAGVPMLEVLKKQELKNVVAIVTRYFGGIKLGAGGLIRAYGNAVSTALEEIGIVEGKLQIEINVTVSYPVSGKLENQLRESIYTLADTLYTDQVTFVCLVDEHMSEIFETEIMDWTNGQATFEVGSQSYQETRITK